MPMDKTFTPLIKSNTSKYREVSATRPAQSTIAFIRQFARAYHVAECNSAPAFYGFVLN